MAVTAALLLIYFGFNVILTLETQRSPSESATRIASLTLALFIQLRHSMQDLSVGRGSQRWTLGLQTLLTYAPCVFIEDASPVAPGFLAASTLLILPAVLSWLLFTANVVTAGVIIAALGHGWTTIVYTTAATVLTGIAVFGLSMLTTLVGRLRTEQTELTLLAVEQERVRFARDLHDTLGYSLSTITLKCELAHRLVPPGTDRAQAEIQEVLRVSRRALADVRAVAHGYMRISLSTEIQSAKSTLAAAGIRSSIRVETGSVPSCLDTLLATILRESLTNVLRHSQARNCWIEAVREDGLLRIAVSNDGVGRWRSRTWGARGLGSDGGTGIQNLRARVEKLGGVLTATTPAEGLFRLTAEVPDAVQQEYARTSRQEPAPSPG